MSSKLLSDRAVLDALGDDALTELGYSEHQTKKWRQKARGIPWRERAKIARFATSKRIKLPVDFAEERRMA